MKKEKRFFSRFWSLLLRHVKLTIHFSVLFAIVRGVSKVVLILITFLLVSSPTRLNLKLNLILTFILTDISYRLILNLSLSTCADSQIISVVRFIHIFHATGRNSSLYAPSWSFVGYSHELVDKNGEKQRVGEYLLKQLALKMCTENKAGL